jgi:site-specific DNA recombinase
MDIGRPTAILYVNVNTDEQATKGYSLKIQEETLLQYCELRDIQVSRIFIEDHSKKTFSRPGWRTRSRITDQ